MLKAHWGCKGLCRGYKGLGFRDYVGAVKGLCRDNGKENGNYYLGFKA